MKSNYLKLLLIVLSVVRTGYGQLTAPKPIKLPSFISTNGKACEFSSMAWWGDRILIVPAMKIGLTGTSEEPVTRSIYYITSDEADVAIGNKDHEVKVDSIEVDKATFDFFIRSKPGYKGIEGTAVVGDHFYFVLETNADDDNNCYLARGHLVTGVKGRKKLVFDRTRPISRSDTGREGDQGFGSLVALTDSILMVVFEFSEAKKGTLFHKFDGDLKITETGMLPVLKATKMSGLYPKDNRLSDMTNNGGMFVGINSIFKGVNDSYSELISYNEKDRKFEPIGSLCDNDCPDSWQGLLRFRNGWLVLSDNKYGVTAETKLSFFPEQQAKAEAAPAEPAAENKPVKKKTKRKPAD